MLLFILIVAVKLSVVVLRLFGSVAEGVGRVG